MAKELENRVIIITELYQKIKKEKNELEKEYNEYKLKNLNNLEIENEKEILQRKYNMLYDLFMNKNISNQQEEIDKLRQKIKDLKEKNIIYVNKISELEEENDLYKEENKKLEEKYNNNIIISEKIEKFEKENKELRKEIDFLKLDNCKLENQKNNLISKLDFYKYNKISNHFNDNDFNNYIYALYIIKEEDVKKEIQLLNYQENDYQLNIFSNKNQIENSCIMFLNNKRMKFRFRFKFFKQGKFSFKFAFTKDLTDASNLFSGCEKLVYLNFSNFNTSQITDMKNMFNGCIRLTKLDLSRFKTNKVENMSKMFYDCIQLKYLNLSGFNTTNLEYTTEMFNGIKKDCKIITNNILLIKEKNKIYDNYNNYNYYLNNSESNYEFEGYSNYNSISYIDDNYSFDS